MTQFHHMGDFVTGSTAAHGPPSETNARAIIEFTTATATLIPARTEKTINLWLGATVTPAATKTSGDQSCQMSESTPGRNNNSWLMLTSINEKATRATISPSVPT